jgi:hypothetical protein
MKPANNKVTRSGFLKTDMKLLPGISGFLLHFTESFDQSQFLKQNNSTTK